MNPRKLAIIVTVLLTFSVYGFPQSEVKDTKHNLSVSGPGQYKSLSETRICKFCHTPHAANPKQPLWNHQLSAVMNYKMYRSPSFEASLTGDAPLSVDGNSRLCLSCHDGTVALGATVRSKAKIKFIEGLGILPPSAKGYIGTDLSGSHPISFVVSDELIARNNVKDTPLNPLHQMKIDPDVRLDAENKMQCTTCHEAHSDKNFASSGIHFWAKPTFNDVCLVCHRM